MKRPKSRLRKVVITDQLVELFRAAWPHAGKRRMTDEQLAAVRAFNGAAALKPWEFSPLYPVRGEGPLQAALVAKLSDAERKAWDRFSRKYE